MKKYPYDIAYNACQIGNFLIHNFKYTDYEIIKLIDKYNLKKINISQGYSKCSIAVINDNSCIVTDKSIQKELEKQLIDVLLIDYDMKIFLLDENNYYSKIQGFIGGAISRIGENVIVFGDIEKIDKDKKIEKFIESKKLKLISFKGLDVIDYGSIIEI